MSFRDPRARILETVNSRVLQASSKIYHVDEYTEKY